MLVSPRYAAAIALAFACGAPALAQDFGTPTEEAPGFGIMPPASDTLEASEPEPDAEAADDAPETEPGEEEAELGEEEAEAPEAEEAEAVPALPGEAVVPQIEIGEVVRDTFDDWEVRCAPDGNDCFLYQLALDSDGNPVAEFSLIRLPEGGEAVAGATVVTPLGTLLPAGLLMQINDGEVRQYPFTFCNQVGCFAQLALTQAQVSALQRGRVARLGVTSIAAPDDPIELDVSLIGFTAGFRSLDAANE